MRLLFLTGAIKIAGGLAAALFISAAIPLLVQALPSWYYVLLLSVFGGSGAVLFLGGRNDARAMQLGLVLVLFATLFTDRLILRALPSLPEGVSVALAMLANLHINALGPYVLWRFACSFPRVHPGLLNDRLSQFIEKTALILGLVLAFG